MRTTVIVAFVLLLIQLGGEFISVAATVVISLLEYGGDS